MMGLKIKIRDRSGTRSVATGSRGGTHGYSSGPLPTKKKKKRKGFSPSDKELEKLIREVNKGKRMTPLK